MAIKDIEVEALIRRLYDARDRMQCELSFERYLDDIRDRLDMVDDPDIWDKYRKYLDEKFKQ
ncbi:hypothetical protein [Halioxenophilus aromaticivorans]|uniref:Uncharacterized protein n=1 Tax=Halioxenophilus aromaticivorans TaxID=1306992 RepID=A0AAV3TX56_9ALTE